MLQEYKICWIEKANNRQGMQNFITQYASTYSECKLLTIDCLTKNGCQNFSHWRPSRVVRQQSVQASLGSFQSKGRWMDVITSESPLWPYYSTIPFHTEGKLLLPLYIQTQSLRKPLLSFCILQIFLVNKKKQNQKEQITLGKRFCARVNLLDIEHIV